MLKPKHSGFFSTTLEMLLEYLGGRDADPDGHRRRTSACCSRPTTPTCATLTSVVPRDCWPRTPRRRTDHALEQMRQGTRPSPSRAPRAGRTPVSRSASADGLTARTASATIATFLPRSRSPSTGAPDAIIGRDPVDHERRAGLGRRARRPGRRRGSRRRRIACLWIVRCGRDRVGDRRRPARGPGRRARPVSSTLPCPGVPSRQWGGKTANSGSPSRVGAGGGQDRDAPVAGEPGEPGQVGPDRARAGDEQRPVGVEEIALGVDVDSHW